MEFHLMIVDDEATIRKGLSRFIDWASINCTVDVTACDGAEAIELLKLHSIDIVITDIKMPEADGIAVARYVYENDPDCKVIILTGYADFQYAQTAIRYNVADFLLKPTSKDQLLKAVQKAQQTILTSKEKNTMAEDEISFLRDQLLQELTDDSLNSSLHAKLLSWDRFSGGTFPEGSSFFEHYYIAAFQLLSREEDYHTLKDIIREQNCGCCYRYNKLILVVYFIKEDKPSVILEHCNEIITFANSLYAMDVSAGLSSSHRGISEYSAAASEAIFALSLTFYSTDNTACYTPDIDPEHYSLTAEDTLCLCEAENCLNTFRFKEAQNHIDSMFRRLTANFAKSVDIKGICTQIYYICCRVLVKKELTPPPSSCLTQIQLAPSILSLEDLVRELFSYLEKELTSHGKKYSAMVENAIGYINRNLALPLSLEAIAGSIHVNPSHLSRTFKKETGSSLTDYINAARVEKAKELLADSSVLTYEISEKTGFRDPAYFSSIFKKYTGLSPKEYRQNILGK